MLIHPVVFRILVDLRRCDMRTRRLRLDVMQGSQLIVSNRNDTSFSVGSPSDSLATFDIGLNGALTFTGLNRAGGAYPRSFSLNKAGTLVAVGLQHSGRVVVLARDVKTGTLSDVVATVEGLGNVTCVVWDEC